MPDEMQAAPDSRQTCEFRANFEGREVIFRDLELWWSDPEPPDQTYPTFSIMSNSELPADAPRLEIECAAPDATNFRDLMGEEFPLQPLSREEPQGWVSVDLGRDFKAKGLTAREWVASGAKVSFSQVEGDAVEGTFEADLERSAASGRAAGPSRAIHVRGQFRARAPKW